MRGHEPPTAPRTRPGSRRELSGKILRYVTGSGVATICSEAAFLLVYGALGATPAVASVIGWLAGAVPSYWLNRTWTWRRRGRPSLRRELLPYVGIVLGTLLVAAVATSSVHAAVERAEVSATTRLVLVSGTFLAVYGGMFLLRFFLFDRLFRGPAPSKETV